MIATNNSASITSKTELLNLVQLDKRDDVYASVEALNNSFNILDELVGVGE